MSLRSKKRRRFRRRHARGEFYVSELRPLRGNFVADYQRKMMRAHDNLVIGALLKAAS